MTRALYRRSDPYDNGGSLGTVLNVSQFPNPAPLVFDGSPGDQLTGYGGETMQSNILVDFGVGVAFVPYAYQWAQMLGSALDVADVQGSNNGTSWSAQTLGDAPGYHLWNNLSPPSFRYYQFRPQKKGRAADFRFWDLAQTLVQGFTEGDFSITATPLTIAQGRSGVSALTLSALFMLGQNVSLSLSPSPSGFDCSFNPYTVVVPGSGTAPALLNVAVQPWVRPGVYPLTIVAQTDLGVTHTVTLNVTVTAAYQGADLRPGVKWTVLGITSMSFWPWNDVAGPYDATTVEIVQGLHEASLGIAVDSVEGQGGEGVFERFAAEVSRAVEVKIAAFRMSMRLRQLLMQGRLSTDPSSASGPEDQYLAPSIGDRIPRFRCQLQTVVGDGLVSILMPKCHLKGTLALPLKGREITVPEFSFRPEWDDGYLTQDGQIGGVVDFFYGDRGQAVRHS